MFRESCLFHSPTNVRIEEVQLYTVGCKAHPFVIFRKIISDRLFENSLSQRRHNECHGVSNQRHKEDIKAPRHWPLCGEFTGTGEFPAQRASNAENVSIWWRHHDAHLTYSYFAYGLCVCVCMCVWRGGGRRGEWVGGWKGGGGVNGWVGVRG